MTRAKLLLLHTWSLPFPNQFASSDHLSLVSFEKIDFSRFSIVCILVLITIALFMAIDLSISASINIDCESWKSFLIIIMEETISLHLGISFAAVLKSDLCSVTSEELDGKFRFWINLSVPISSLLTKTETSVLCIVTEKRKWTTHPD